MKAKKIQIKQYSVGIANMTKPEAKKILSAWINQWIDLIKPAARYRVDGCRILGKKLTREQVGKIGMKKDFPVRYKGSFGIYNPAALAIQRASL